MSTSQLIPVPNDTTNWSWTWNGRDPEQPVGASTRPQEGNLLIYGDLYNVASNSSGNVTTSYSTTTGAVTTQVSFTNLVLQDTNGSPAGFPDFLYGFATNGVNDVNTSAPLLQLPMQASAVIQNNVGLSAAYTINNPNNDLIDFVYDMFFTPSVSDSPGGLELEIFPYFAGPMSGSSQSVLENKFTSPTVVNGTLYSSYLWDVYVQPGGFGQEVAISPDASNSVQIGPNEPNGLGINLSDFIANSIDNASVLAEINEKQGTSYSTTATGANDPNNLYLNNVQLGSEFWPSTNSKAVSYSYTVTSFTLSVSVNVLSVTTAPTSGAFDAGKTLAITLTMSGAVTVSGGTPSLSLNDNGSAVYNAAASTATSLVFDYTVAAGQNTASLAVTGVDPNGASIVDSGGNTVDLSGAAATFSNVAIDTTAPSVIADATAGAPVNATVVIAASRLEFNDNLSSHAQETYTITSGPRDGTLLLNGTPTTSFTQAQIDAGQVGYHETGVGATSDMFTFSVSDAAGNTTTGSFQILIPPPHNDLNGDGASDILWSNPANSDLGWNDGVDTLWHDLDNTPTNYEVVATANLNGGEQADLLWWNPETGDTGWNDGIYTTWHDLGVAPTSYKIVGAADYNGDGHPDLLWTNSATGDIGWNDGVDTPWHDLGGVMSGYQVAGSGDLTGDGTADIVLSNSTTGDITYWLMNAGSVQNPIDLGDVPSGYQFAGLGDFLGNGIDEILLHNPTTGDTGFWQLSGGSGVTFDDLGAMNTGYRVASVGQYTGNGIDDILWTNPTTGDAGYWKLAGGTVQSFVDLGSAGNSGYHILT